MLLLVQPLPGPVRSRLLRDKTFVAKFGVEPQFWFPLGADQVETKTLHQALRAAASARKSAKLRLNGGRHVQANGWVTRGRSCHTSIL